MSKIILRKPMLTEKASLGAEKGIYSFEIAPDANKIEVAAAVKAQFNVEVDKVRTLWMPLRKHSQFTRKGVLQGVKSRRKKAVVYLKPGQTIDVFTPMDVKAEGGL